MDCFERSAVSALPSKYKGNKFQKMRVAILGTGKIGTDLLVKINRSSALECVMFAGRNLESDGMRFAADLGIAVSDKGIDAILNADQSCQLVFDATSAACHIHHATAFASQGIFAVDLTPSQIGECCVPALGMHDIFEHHNVSMISCGGQSSIPLASVLSKAIPNISKIQVKSIVSANSIGPGTLANIEEYYRNTKAGLKKYTGLDHFDVDLIVDEINLDTKMLTTIKAITDFTNIDALKEPLEDILHNIQAYVPGYQLDTHPVLERDGIRVNISVTGRGDYLPTYAGNLDIINCAAVAVAEAYANHLKNQRNNKVVKALKLNDDCFA